MYVPIHIQTHVNTFINKKSILLQEKNEKQKKQP